MGLIKFCFTAVFLMAAVRMDLEKQKIRNAWILLGITAGIILWLPSVSAESCKDLLAGLALPVVICWIPFLMHALGAGDIKLFSVIGCLYGGKDAVSCIGYSFLTAAGISLILLIRSRQLRTSLTSCFLYFHQILRERKVMPYPGCEIPDHLMHFSVAILIGFAVMTGVKYCRMIPL